MPNWVRNIVKVSNDRAIGDCLVDGEFDFNKVIKMPENIFRGNLGLKEREKYGADNWYDWSCENWGTKWNASETHKYGPRCVEFDTAWSTPEPVVQRLSKKYHCLVEVWYADEGITDNSGYYSYDNGGYAGGYNGDSDFCDKVWCGDMVEEVKDGEKEN